MDSRMTAIVEALITWCLMTVAIGDLTNDNFLNTFEVEMAAALSICKMEIAGIGVDNAALKSLITTIKCNLFTVEKKIYQLVGRTFSLTSKKEIVKVIGLQNSRKTDTLKVILEDNKHPAASLISLWRKLSYILNTMLQPLSMKVKSNRIYGNYIMLSSTGRTSMHEPNIQNVAKDFDFVNPFNSETITISCRSVFIPREGYTFLSADFCQLEFRMLAHLSGDTLLRNILNSDEDIFKSITAKWNGISEGMVTDALRTRTKQICYGIIYGIGVKALARQLNVEVNEAALFMENFKATYPGIETYIQTIITSCRSQGYIETIYERRRYLPFINDDNSTIKSHAERQAVNSAIQGSASDLVKKALKKVDETIHTCLKETERPRLVLFLHDEFIFEVPDDHLCKNARLIKRCMETCDNLSVPFPVKLKSGYSWGQLTEYCDSV